MMEWTRVMLDRFADAAIRERVRVAIDCGEALKVPFPTVTSSSRPDYRASAGSGRVGRQAAKRRPEHMDNPYHHEE